MLSVRPEFVEINGRRLFCLRGQPDAGVAIRYRVLVAPPFAEELNKCRRLLALTLANLGGNGCDVLLPDLYGTGDSAGELRDACWDDWIADWSALAAWHAQTTVGGQPAVLALRSGAMLAGAALGRSPVLRGAHVVLAQPVFDGRRFLQQFLRLRVVAERMAGGAESTLALERQIAAGDVLEIGGYPLSSRVAEGLAASRVEASQLASAAAVVVLEFKSSGGSPSAPAQQLCAQLDGLGCAANASVVAADQFWATAEISAMPAVVAALVEAFD